MAIAATGVTFQGWGISRMSAAEMIMAATVNVRGLDMGESYNLLQIFFDGRPPARFFIHAHGGVSGACGRQIEIRTINFPVKVFLKRVVGEPAVDEHSPNIPVLLEKLRNLVGFDVTNVGVERTLAFA